MTTVTTVTTSVALPSGIKKAVTVVTAVTGRRFTDHKSAAGGMAFGAAVFAPNGLASIAK